MSYVWIALAVIAGITIFGWLLALALHRVIDWRENRWPKQDEWNSTTTGSLFPVTEPRKVSDLGSFFEPEQPAEDPWTNGVESWSVDHGFHAEDKLDVIRAFAKAGFDEVPTPAPLPVEQAEPAMLFDNLTAEYKQVNPHVAGRTQTWMKPTDEELAAMRDVYTTWNGFGTEPADTPAIEPRRTRRTVAPAQRDSGAS